MGLCTKTSCISGRMQLFKKCHFISTFALYKAVSSSAITFPSSTVMAKWTSRFSLMCNCSMVCNLAIFEGDQIVSHPQPYHTVNNVIIIFQTFAPQLPYSAPQNPQNVPCS